jgi:hypothetical protein
MTPVARHATATDAGEPTFRPVYRVRKAAQRLAHHPPAKDGIDREGVRMPQTFQNRPDSAGRRAWACSARGRACAALHEVFAP